MAAVTKTSKKASKLKASTNNHGPLAGLHLSKAQFQAYSSAYTAAARAARTKIALRAAATRFRSYRLNSAYATMAKYRAKNKSVQAAGVAAFAVRQSYLQGKQGHQSAGLQSRLAAEYHHSVTILGRLQYARSGEKKYVTAAVMRTVTQSQAMSHEKKVFAQAGKAARKGASTRKYPPTLTSAQKASVQAAGTRAGQAAARKVPASRKAAAGTAITGPRSRNWLGRPEVPNCVPVAVANAMLLHTGHRPGKLLFRRLDRECGPDVTIPQALGILRVLLRDADHPVQIQEFDRVPAALGKTSGYVIGYESEYGPHAAVSLPGRRVISWGAEMDFDGVPEEAYEVTWAEAACGLPGSSTCTTGGR